MGNRQKSTKLVGLRQCFGLRSANPSALQGKIGSRYSFPDNLTDKNLRTVRLNRCVFPAEAVSRDLREYPVGGLFIENSALETDAIAFTHGRN